ncbi:hypothetical protein EGR_02922 [Echinococcus granulosus]|uniref:Uncharacterized protein n=1 Tax=Echinococcus granulosus TaxID=6210 RepID=W6UKW4_ECHGR|nr:hypothetical protein EGR_02922 [Echinococcus granulosus]EUB62170.1 hypothetical protein EGR_02922 [Echinococcus granulosus]
MTAYLLVCLCAHDDAAHNGTAPLQTDGGAAMYVGHTHYLYNLSPPAPYPDPRYTESYSAYAVHVYCSPSWLLKPAGDHVVSVLARNGFSEENLSPSPRLGYDEERRTCLPH